MSLGLKTLLALCAVLVIALGLYYWQPAGEKVAVYSDESLPLSFEYRVSPNGYVVEEPEESGEVKAKKTIVLIAEEDYDSILNGERSGGEAPPSISIRVYESPEGLSPIDWAEKNYQLSNVKLIRGTLKETMIAGKEAISYEADGLYPSRNAIFASGDLIYMVSGSYLEENSQLYRDFSPILESLNLSQRE